MKSSNYRVIQFGGLEILQSYRTLIGYCLPNCVPVVSSKYWSNTTSRHRNRWLGGRESIEVDQDVLEAKARLLASTFGYFTGQRGVSL